SYLRHLFSFFNDPALTNIYTLSLHDALPISPRSVGRRSSSAAQAAAAWPAAAPAWLWSSLVLPAPLVAGAVPRAVARPPAALAADRKSTRLNSSHVAISYAVFRLKKKKHKST